MATTDSLPRFFKVFHSQYSSDSMLIPIAYNDQLPLRLFNTAILQGPGGRSWNVAMNIEQDEVYFEHGWARFVEETNLSDGDYLTFLYNGDRTFEVRINDHNGDKAVTEVEEDKEDSSYAPDNEDIVTCVKPKVANLKKQEAAKKRERVEPKIKNPKTYLDDPENLHFETNVKYRINELLVPAQLVKDNGLRFGDYVDYIDKKGNLKAETAKYKSRIRSSVLIKKWVVICRRNELKKEDRVLCELFCKENSVYAIKLHIFRGSDLYE